MLSLTHRVLTHRHKTWYQASFEHTSQLKYGKYTEFKIFPSIFIPYPLEDLFAFTLFTADIPTNFPQITVYYKLHEKRDQSYNSHFNLFSIVIILSI